jgi:hypothetical protein
MYIMDLATYKKHLLDIIHKNNEEMIKHVNNIDQLCES